MNKQWCYSMFNVQFIFSFDTQEKFNNFKTLPLSAAVNVNTRNTTIIQKILGAMFDAGLTRTETAKTMSVSSQQTIHHYLRPSTLLVFINGSFKTLNQRLNNSQSRCLTYTHTHTHNRVCQHGQIRCLFIIVWNYSIVSVLSISNVIFYKRYLYVAFQKTLFVVCRFKTYYFQCTQFSNEVFHFETKLNINLD